MSDSATPWNAAHQASLSFTTSQRKLKLMSIEPMMPSSHPVTCLPLLFWPSIFPSIRVFFNKSTLYITSSGQSIGTSAAASVLTKNIQGWSPLGLICVMSLLSKEFSSLAPQFESIDSLVLSLFYGPILTSVHDYWKKKIIGWLFGPLLAKWCLWFLICCLGFSGFPSKVKTSFNFMTAVTIHSDSGAKENKVCHCFHCFPIFLPWDVGARWQDLSFLNAEF